MKTALITGITGMDGSHMADLLLSKGYKVFGLERHKSVPNRENIKHIENHIEFVKGDLTDQNSLVAVLERIQPDEIYNFAAQSFVGDSWILTEMTANVTAIGVLHLLEAVRTVNKHIKVHQASSSEMFGNHGRLIVDESTPLTPFNPYAVAKTFAHHMAINYRASYGMFVSMSICFNHESERRGYEFVTRKISDGVARIFLGLQDKLKLGNLDAKRDWGYAPEYCEGIWRMMQLDNPGEFIFATGEAHSVREFVEEAFKAVGITTWQHYVEIDPRFIRPAETNYLLGDYTKAKTLLDWEPKVKFHELVKIMVQNDIQLTRNKLNGKNV